MSNRSVIVTGGFGTLGQVVSTAFSKTGDKVARIDFAPSAPAGSTFLDIGGIDLTDAKMASEAAQKVSDEMGGIDVVVNVAGGFAWETIVDGSSESWRRMYEMNVATALNMSRAALPFLLQSDNGRVINVGAAAALKTDTGMGAYTAAKSGVHRLTEALAAEFSGHQLTINAILPTIIDTPTNRKDMPDADFSQWVPPEAIADTILFLASPAARAISGALIPVSKGS